jgi:transcriptional regulator with XRE-family HTH domain
MTSEAEAFYKILGQRIHDLRSRRKFTQEFLGALLVPPLTRASIANIEAGKQGVLTHTFVSIARALAVAPKELLGDDAPIRELREKVQTELQKKLSVPHDTSARLMQKLFEQSKPTTRRQNERTSRKTHR